MLHVFPAMHRSPRFALPLLLLLSLTQTPHTGAETVRLEQASVTELRQQLAELQSRRESGDSSPHVIELPAGTYRLQQPLRLSPELVGQGLTIRGSEAGGKRTTVSFSGALPLAAPERRGDRWHYQLPAALELDRSPVTILIDGKLNRPARHPNVGYHRIVAAAEDRRRGFEFDPADLPAELDLAAAPCDLVFLHDWSSSRLPLAEIDREQAFLTTVGPIGCQADHYAIDHFETHPRYRLEGHPALADLPGEWYVNLQAGELVVIADDDATAPAVEIPHLETLIVAGTQEAPLRGLRFQDVAFTGTRFPMPPGGLAGAQATMHEPRDASGQRTTGNRPMLSAAVHLTRPQDCVFERCQFRGLGNTALWIGSRARACTVRDCEFADLGGNAINLGENNDRRVDDRSWYQSAPEQVPSENQVVGCRLRHCGVVLPGSVAIWAALHQKLEIHENEISDCPYTGISLGWLWSQTVSPAGQNRIHHNRITRVMQVLSDGGGIYTLGRQPGSELRFNTITNVPLNAGRAESNGMFLDEGTTGFLVADNVFRRIAKSPLRFHRAGTNVVKHNRWELETVQTPPVRYNNTPEENITVTDNDVLPREPRIFLIGNSLTWDTRPMLLDHYVDWHVDCGKSLKHIFEHPAAPCVASSRLWPTALDQLNYDFLVVQPHYGTTLTEDTEVISKWVQMQPEATVVIHSGWARSATAAKEYAQRDGDQMGHRPGYFERLLKALRERFPQREFRRTFTTEALHRVAEDLGSGAAPLDDLKQLYRDAIHMTHGEGRYLMHNLMRAALGQPPSDEGFPIAEENPDLKAYLDQLIARRMQRE